MADGVEMPIEGERAPPLDFANHEISRSNELICDNEFNFQLRNLKRLRFFLIQETIKTPADFSLGALNQLRSDIKGRHPTSSEWLELEAKTQVLFELLTGPLRVRFLRSGIPSWISVLAIVLTVISALTMALAIGSKEWMGEVLKFPKPLIASEILPLYLIWLLSLGGLGSVAFIGMNALLLQNDITFDIGNNKLMILRITLGSLFALVISLPFGFPSYFMFLSYIIGLDREVDPASKMMDRAMLLILPFLLGFSTSLVIMILNRFIDAVHSFFGKPAA